MTIHDIAKTERTEMYLKAVYTVAQATPPVTISKVAEYMGVSAPSSYEMLKRLESQGLLQSSSEEGYRLTRRGMATATRVVRRLRLAERLLTDILRLDLSRVYEEACKLEHVISPEVEARLDDVLGHPATCPHGLPIPGEGPEPVESLRTLGELEVWDRVTVVSIPEEDASVVALLAEVGLLPGVSVLVREIGPLKGPITVQIADQIRAIGREVAGRVRVRPSA
jgi:DtxR family Mn-dependent transcriptional regulator